MKMIMSALLAASVFAAVAAPASAHWSPKDQQKFWQESANF